ncbi:MAG: 1-deoxy-D-xylulose-5-phosphate reductoisomerase [Deltaproteobacteria bacterium]|nr:1-deoxy-D-xylulose-5-phosphate reductoisomerase [Deltaproteobacteria bacterium]
MTEGGTTGVTILGSTGSIGRSTLEVVADFPEQYRIVALAAGQSIELLAEQVRAFRPKLVSVKRAEDVSRLRAALAGAGCDRLEIASGPEGADAVAAHPDGDVVVTAMVGAAGLAPTLVAVRRGARMAIANKEPLVVAGKLVTDEARRCGATILPVDSEHNAIYQCLSGQRREDVRRILLTCSGGPFRTTADLSQVTLEQALKHPTWSMGPKITIDSATLMNKGLEVIEAHWLFGLPAEQLDVVIHPQSVIHSMVEYVDGSVIAQLGTPDMKVPIGYALAYPRRLPLKVPRLDFAALGTLAFEAPDRRRFPCLNLAYQALAVGGAAPAVLNAANETAVAAFLDRRIRYLDIPSLIERTLEAHSSDSAGELEPILAADLWARRQVQSYLG